MRGTREVQGRLRDMAGHERPEDARLSRQLRMLSAAGRLPTLGRVPVGTHSGRAASIALRVLVVLLCLAAAGGAARATVSMLVRRWQRGATATAPVARQGSAGHPIARRAVALGHAAAPMPVAPLPSALPPWPHEVGRAAAPVSASQPAYAIRQPAASRAMPRTMGASDPPAHQDVDGSPARQLAAEADSLRRALVAFRARDDHEVLAILDGYTARYPHGVLSLEATKLRAQVLLRLGDRPGALRLLDQLSLSGAGQTAEIMVTRAELRSLGGRCPEALPDFDRALDPTARLASGERARALLGRASCRGRTGDAAGAERDRQQYLREFPQGPSVEHPARQP